MGVAIVMLFASGVIRMNASDEDDKKAVALLDTQYQAAVEKNDAATMDRILADGFILVVGNGKTYGKADLLKEARARSVVYEHQSDSEQAVRKLNYYMESRIFEPILEMKTHGMPVAF